jgi:exoribonuclease R
MPDDNHESYETEFIIKDRRHAKIFSLGDNVRVKIARINTFRSDIDSELVQTSKSSAS